MKSTCLFPSATPKTPEILAQSMLALLKENSSPTFFKHFLEVYNWTCLSNTLTGLMLTFSAQQKPVLDQAKNLAADSTHTDDHSKLMVETTGVDGGITTELDSMGRQIASARSGSIGNHLRIQKRYIFKNEICSEKLLRLQHSKTPKPS